jgi:hypothetical protein
LGAPCQLLLLAGREHGRTIPLADLARQIGRLTASSAYYDFTDLNDRGLVGIVWDVRHDFLGVRPKTSLECRKEIIRIAR